MPATYYVRFSEQTHAECQGFAPDDNIESHTYVVLVADEDRAEIDRLIAEIQNLHYEKCTELSKEWEKDHPGDWDADFTGTKWAEGTITEMLNDNPTATTEWVKLKLMGLLNELSRS
jgi:hypothetical protein